MDIRAIRESKGWTQDEMADYLGVDRSTVSRMENGRPPTRPIQKLLDALSCEAVSEQPEAAE